MLTIMMFDSGFGDFCCKGGLQVYHGSGWEYDICFLQVVSTEVYYIKCP